MPPRKSRTSRPGPSITDVARHVGLSQQTVSRVANGATNVRPETRDRVVAAMTELGYVPNQAARALRSGSFASIGLIAHRLSRTGESRIAEAVVDGARDAGYTVTLVDVEEPDDERVADAAQRLTHQAVDGLVLLRAEGAPPEFLFPARIPVVVADSRPSPHYATVTADEFGGGGLAVDHLLGLGHRTVHHVGGPADSVPGLLRERGWRAALTAAGAPVTEVVRGDWTAHSGLEIGARLAQDPTVTAVWCANDEMAAGVMLAMHRSGRRIPHDVSIVGFDGIELTEVLWPPLTTVRQDFDTVGRHLVAALLAQIPGAPGSGEDAVPPRHQVLPVSLLERESTAPPPQR